MRRLAPQCQILVENFRPGSLKKYGLDYAAVAAINPALVYCSITGFGQTGPYAKRPGYDYIIQGMGGLMSLTGEPSGEPMKSAVAVADLFTGMYAVTSILAALRHAERTGEGQHLDISLLDCQIAMLANLGENYLVSGGQPQRYGNQHASIAPYQVLATADGHIILAVGNDAQFRDFLRGCRRASATKSASPPTKRASSIAQALTEALGPIMRTRTTANGSRRSKRPTFPAAPSTHSIKSTRTRKWSRAAPSKQPRAPTAFR